MRDRFSKFEEEWKSFKWRIKLVTEELRAARYDGVTLREESNRYASKLETGLFLLPAAITWKAIEEILVVPSPPGIRMPPEAPPLRCDPAWCPDWYTKKMSAGAMTRLEADLETRSRLAEEGRQLRAEVLSKRDEFDAVHAAVTNEMARLEWGYAIKDPRSLARLIEVSNGKHLLPDFLRTGFRVRVDETAAVALIEFEFPDYARVQLPVDRRKNRSVKYASATQKKKLVRMCLYSLVIRAGYLGGRILDGSACQTIAINVRQAWFDPATGAPRDGIICTVQAGVADFLRLSLDTLDPEVCFRHLKGIAIPSFDAISPVRPIFVLDKTDDRFVDRKLVDSVLPPDANLAAMPWEDFEHLVAQLFEWEFAKQGIEVKVTRASRDRGVDAILFDPDPLRGGKFVLQS